MTLRGPVITAGITATVSQRRSATLMNRVTIRLHRWPHSHPRIIMSPQTARRLSKERRLSEIMISGPEEGASVREAGVVVDAEREARPRAGLQKRRDTSPEVPLVSSRPFRPFRPVHRRPCPAGRPHCRLSGGGRGAGRPGLSFIHRTRGWTVVSLPMAVHAARRHKVQAHRRAMTGMFVGGLIVAGALTFLPGRLMGAIFFSQRG